MPSARVSALTREDITAAAKRLHGSRPAKWTAIIDGREFPARPLVLDAAGVPPNDPTNSHQAVAKLKSLGFDTRYEGRPEIGFVHGAPENPDRVWEKQVNGRTVVFKKKLVRKGL